MDRTPRPTAPESDPGSGFAPTEPESAGSTSDSPAAPGKCVYCGAPTKPPIQVCDYCVDLMKGM